MQPALREFNAIYKSGVKRLQLIEQDNETE